MNQRRNQGLPTANGWDVESGAKDRAATLDMLFTPSMEACRDDRYLADSVNSVRDADRLDSLRCCLSPWASNFCFGH